MDIHHFFHHHVPELLASAPETLNLGHAFGFVIEGENSGKWTLNLGKELKCSPLIEANTDCIFTITDTDFKLLLDTPSKARTLFLEKKIKLEGKLEVAMHLPTLLSVLSNDKRPSGLKELFGEALAKKFTTEFWPDKLAVFHDVLERIPEISNINELKSVNDLLSRWKANVRLSDKYGGRLVSSKEGAELYQKGYHLAFSDVEKSFPELRSLLDYLRICLKLPLNTFGRCLVYASPDKVGEVLHFDQNVNFIIQLSGEKHWYVAPNNHIAYPTDRYTTASPEPSPELKIYGPDKLPVSLPDNAEKIVLKRGSILFLPPGYWHQTTAVGHSFSLNFTFDQPNWADILIPAIRQQLLKHEHWRQLATGAGSANQTDAIQAEQHLNQLIQNLLSELKDLTAASAFSLMTPTQAVSPNNISDNEK